MITIITLATRPVAQLRNFLDPPEIVFTVIILSTSPCSTLTSTLALAAAAEGYPQRYNIYGCIAMSCFFFDSLCFSTHRLLLFGVVLTCRFFDLVCELSTVKFIIFFTLYLNKINNKEYIRLLIVFITFFNNLYQHPSTIFSTKTILPIIYQISLSINLLHIFQPCRNHTFHQLSKKSFNISTPKSFHHSPITNS